MSDNCEDSSSDDSVCFGPYTMKEAKRDARKRKPNPISFRHSSICRFRHFDIPVPKEIEPIAPELGEGSNDDSTNRSEEYHTPEHIPNETSAASEEERESAGSEFLEKLSKVINEPLSKSSYNFAAFEHSNEPQQTQSNQRVSENIEENIIIISDDSSSSGYDICSLTGSGSDSDIRPPTPYEDLSFKFDDHLGSMSETRESSNCESRINPPEIKITDCTLPEISLNIPKADDGDVFDDTLEEMTRFLEQGAEYVMPEKITPVKPSDAARVSPLPGSFSSSLYSDVKATTPTTSILPEGSVKKFYSAERIIGKPSVGVPRPKTVANSKFQHMESKIKPPSINVKALFSKTTTLKSAEKLAKAPFKIPGKPPKKPPTPAKVLNPALKNVVSPVGIYINHSRKYTPMINVPEKTTHTKTKMGPPVLKSSSKENVPKAANMEIPLVIYRPAKTKVASEMREVNLPNSIKKLVGTQTVTKHERRFETDEVCNESIERRLMESDLSVDAGHDASSNISILTHKQAFNLKKF